MTGWGLRLYHGLPYPLRSLVASTRGVQLRRRRYGTDTDALVAEARERERWSTSRTKGWQAARLEALLRRAVTQVPYYCQQWAGREEWSRLENWPVLRKETLRSAPDSFLAADRPRFGMHFDATSGTTGTPIRIAATTRTTREWFALAEARWRGWAGVTRSDRWAILGGQLVVGVDRRRAPFWVWNGGLRQLYLSSYHLGPASVGAYLEALEEHRVEYLWGYPSAMFALASLALDQGLAGLRLKAAISNAEPLLAHQREAIGRAFDCHVYDTYGMAEMVAAASECEEGRLHLWPEAGIVEVLGDGCDETVGDGVVGRLVCTGLANRDMPLIRYEVGDRGAVAPVEDKCPCGRTMRVLQTVEGRSDDVLFTVDGRRVGRLDPVFKGTLPIVEAQIRQESLDVVRVLVVPSRGFGECDAEDIRQRLRDRMGNITVRVEVHSHLPRAANGKLRAVVCDLSADEAARARQGSRNDVRS